MKNASVLMAILALALCSSAVSAQSSLSWKRQPSQPAAQPASSVHQSTPQASSAQEIPQTTASNSSALVNKAECDAEVAMAYPVNLWAPGLSKKREELFAACMSRRSDSTAQSGGSPSVDKAECDAVVAKAYPINLWAPGLGKKRKELFAACMAKRGNSGSAAN